MQLEDYLERDDRIVLPLGSTEQHAYLSLETDNLLAERVAIEAAEPLGVPVLPVLAYGVAPRFAAYPGSPSISDVLYVAVLSDLLSSLRVQGFARVLIVNGHGGNSFAAEQVAADGVRWHDWWRSERIGRWSTRSIPTRATRPGWRASVDAAGGGRAAGRAQTASGRFGRGHRSRRLPATCRRRLLRRFL